MTRVIRSAWRLLTTSAPIVMAGAFVLLGFVANAVPLGLLWRPLGIALLAAAAMEALVVWRLGWLRGPFWSFVVVTAVLGMFTLAGAGILVLTLLAIVRSAPGREYVLAGGLAGVVAWTFLLILATMGMTRSAFDWTPIPGRAYPLGAEAPGPSVYVLVLDGYPRADVLESLGFDNEPFLAEMDERGFDVSRESHSNYLRTPFSVLTMLSLVHLEDVNGLWATPIPRSAPEQQRLTARALLDPPIFEMLEEVGYRTRALTGTVAHVPIGGADVTWTAGTANNFELSALQRTPLAGVLEWFGFAAGQQRDHISHTLAEFGAVTDNATFTYAHVLAPHAPFVFAADGSPVSAPPCYPMACALFDGQPEVLGVSPAEYRTRLIGQVRYVNKLLVDAVDRIVGADPTAVVVVVSDHGVSGEDQLTHFRNLVLARTPGHPRLLGDDATLVNVLPSIVRAYLDPTVSLLPDTLYRSHDSPWLSVEAIESGGNRSNVPSDRARGPVAGSPGRGRLPPSSSPLNPRQ